LLLLFIDTDIISIYLLTQQLTATKHVLYAWYCTALTLLTGERKGIQPVNKLHPKSQRIINGRPA